MEGAQHLQGYYGYGPIPNKLQPEPTNGPGGPSPWTEAWEGPFTPCYSLTSVVYEAPATAQPKNNNLDMARWGRETMEPRNYHNTSYYDLWLGSVARWLQRGGYATTAELTGKRRYRPAIIDEASLDMARAVEDQGKTEAVLGFGRPVKYETIGGVLYATYASPDYREPKTEADLPQPKYKVGDRVRARLQHSAGHTREYPIYRGHVGEVVADYGLAIPKYQAGGAGPQTPVFQPFYQRPYPDISSKGLQTFLIPLYGIRFLAKDLYGAEFVEHWPTNPSTETSIYVDLWETYLEPA